MKELEKMQSGLEYCYDDEEVSLMKLNAIENANKKDFVLIMGKTSTLEIILLETLI